MPTTSVNRNNILISIIFIFHLVGVIGFLTKPDLFEPLSPLNLILSVILILLANTNHTWKFYVPLLLVATIGFLVEVIGVKTHLVFGNYWYGNSFGFLVFGVPLLIGVNWAFLTYGTAQFCNFKNKFINSLIGAILMVGLDFFIEQNAATYHFWYWENNHIPLQNYIAWFFISLFINILFQHQLKNKPNKVAKYFYLIQVLFFGSLYIFNRF